MLLRRGNAYPDFWERKTFKGPLDIRAPEDHLVVDTPRSNGHTITSPAINSALVDFEEAMKGGIKGAARRAAQDVVDATSAYFRMSGVPTFAHDPVPPQLIKAALPPEHLGPGEHTAIAVNRFVDLFDDSVKTLLREQVSKQLARSPALLNDSSRDVVAPNSSITRGVLGEPSAPSPDTHAPVMQMSASRANVDRRTEQQRFDDLDARDPIAAVAHPFAYGLDATLNDLVGEDGLLGDWGKRRVIPKPSGFWSGFAGEVVRTILEAGPPVGLAAKGVGFASSLRSEVAKRGTDAFVGGGLSVVAQWLTDRDLPVGKRATKQDYLAAFLSGAASGATGQFKHKAAADAALAVGASLAKDYWDGNDFSFENALAAGACAWIMSTLGGKIEGLGIGAQGAGRVGRKLAEKYLKDFMQDTFGRQLKLTREEWDRFWNGFDKRWLQQGD